MEAKVLTISSKGQIAIPVEMRRQLDIESGDKVVAYASGDVIMLKVLRLPSVDEFKASLDEAQTWASEAGYTEADVDSIIKSVRKRNRE